MLSLFSHKVIFLLIRLTIVARNNIVWKFGPQNSKFFWFPKISWKGLQWPVVSAEQRLVVQTTLFLI